MDVKPVTETEQLAHDAAVVARINAAERRRARVEIARWFLVAACLPVAASGWYAWAVHPRIQQEIQFIPIADNGSPLMALRDEEMPPEARKMNIQNSIINYVLRREGFNDLEADKNYDIVSRMSAKDIRDEYQSMNAMNKDGSQWKTYSGGGWIKVEYDSMEDLAPPTGYSDVPPAYLVRFCRQVKRKDKGMPERPELWGATVGFKADVKGYDGRLIRAHNPGRVQVTEYPNVRQIGPLVNNNANPRGNGCSAIK